MTDENEKIIVEANGPYIVRGAIPLVRKSPVLSEHGEPLTWKKDGELREGGNYFLCRCGQSRNKPYCDDTHEDIDFDGTESADTGPIADRQNRYDGTNIVVKDDRSLCMHAGFCGTRITNVWKMLGEAEDTHVRAQIIGMVERCPSGSLTFALEADGEALEPDLPKVVAVTPDGPLWVSGGITIERSDGEPFETRNRVTLCSCGASKNKPLCDGTHKEIGFSTK